ncbi:translation initiation factor IF-3 [bacterium]|nr:translation initiation factor IF-3 [bacterium]
MAFIRRGLGRPKFNKDKDKINEFIRVKEVRLIGAEGEQLGVFLTREAIEKARDLGMDLVEISPNASPPVCKIMDYGKFKYEKSKKQKDAKKKQVVTHLKEIKLRPKTDKHDLEHKIKHAKEFFEEGDKVKFTIRFRGREMAYKEQGRAIMEDILKQLGELVHVEQSSRMEGYTMSIVVAPVKKK